MDKELKAKIEDIFSRGVGEFIDPNESLKKKLLINPEKVVIKYGVDPTKPDIHLGHAVCLRKLKQFKEIGCKIIFLIGDFTAMIGDPTGKNQLRPELKISEIHENMLTYVSQIKKILNSEDFIGIQNSTWFMPFDDVWINAWDKKNLPFFNDSKADLLDEYIRERKKWETETNRARQFISLQNTIYNFRKITADQILERDMFKERKKNNEPIYMNELIYPILQGIDSLVIGKWMGSCDLEIGGTDQHFNMLMGRTVMERGEVGMNPQSVLTIKILEGTDGKEKMSKSLDNYIGITEQPNDMFGKVMSIPDSSIMNYFELCTDVPMDEIKKIGSEMKKEKLNPRDAKLRLAGEIVEIYHGEEAARVAREYFINTFSKKEIPNEVSEFEIKGDSKKLAEILVESGNAKSLSDARRKIEQGGVSIDDEKIIDAQAEIGKDKNGKVLKIGKLGFVKIIFE